MLEPGMRFKLIYRAAYASTPHPVGTEYEVMYAGVIPDGQIGILAHADGDDENALAFFPGQQNNPHPILTVHDGWQYMGDGASVMA